MLEFRQARENDEKNDVVLKFKFSCVRAGVRFYHSTHPPTAVMLELRQARENEGDECNSDVLGVQRTFLHTSTRTHTRARTFIRTHTNTYTELRNQTFLSKHIFVNSQ